MGEACEASGARSTNSAQARLKAARPIEFGLAVGGLSQKLNRTTLLLRYTAAAVQPSSHRVEPTAYLARPTPSQAGGSGGWRGRLWFNLGRSQGEADGSTTHKVSVTLVPIA